MLELHSMGRVGSRGLAQGGCKDRWCVVLLVMGWLAVSVFPRAALASAEDVRAVVLLRALAYDDGLKTRAVDKIVIAVVVPNLSAAADNPIHAGMKGISNLTIQGMPLSIVDLHYTDSTALKRAIVTKDVDVLYLGKGLDGVVAEIVRVGRELRVPSMAIQASYLTEGVAVAAVQTDQGDKPKLVVNLASAKAQGMLLRPELLRIAQVIE